MNFERQFTDTVISNFVNEYASGRTPIPCAHCNSDLKFSTLLDRARGLGAEHLATGHYARVEQDADGRFLLRRSRDPDKDQSHFLFSLTQDQLARAVFPVGRSRSARCGPRRIVSACRSRTRRTARRSASCPTATTRPSSSRAMPVRPGPIVDEWGERLATHAGVHRFYHRSAQGSRRRGGRRRLCAEDRRRLGRCDRSGHDRRSIARTSRRRDELDCARCVISMDSRDAQIRHRHRPASGRVRALTSGRAEFEFDEPQPAGHPGQAAVFYDGDIVIGGGC